MEVEESPSVTRGPNEGKRSSWAPCPPTFGFTAVQLKFFLDKQLKEPATSKRSSFAPFSITLEKVTVFHPSALTLRWRAEDSPASPRLCFLSSWFADLGCCSALPAHGCPLTASATSLLRSASHRHAFYAAQLPYPSKVLSFVPAVTASLNSP